MRESAFDIVITGFAGLSGSRIIYNEESLRSRLLETYPAFFFRPLCEAGMGCEGSGGADETEEVCASVEALRELEGLARQQEEAGLMVRAGEGGIYAAMWKLLKARRLGAEYSQRAIPILQQTIEICETWSLDPYRLDSAGAGVWLMSGGALGLVALAERAYGPGSAAAVGRTMKGPAIKRVDQEEIAYMRRPGPDELQRLFAKA